MQVNRDDEVLWDVCKTVFTDMLRDDCAKARAIVNSQIVLPIFYVKPFFGEGGRVEVDKDEDINHFFF